ncbi:transposable element Tcb2 transposase [Trichonephila clavipes]|nr:transposable element Tcb2 transposase [Trichonephila clavipes]
MSSRHHIDDFMRGRSIGKIEEGRKITDVAREFDIAHSVVSRLWKSFKTTGMCSRRHGGGRVRSTTPAEDRYIVLSAKRNRRTTSQQVANQFLPASGKQISRKTVARRLRGGGLYARRPVVCGPLTGLHRTARLQWCREHHNWTEQDWACVLFSDESRFSLSSDCRRQLIWRESGTAYSPENILEKDRYPTCSIMVWAGIMINGRTRLHVVANGTMTDQRYIDEVLLPHVRLFRGAVCDKFVFMDDNATCHRTLAVQDCLDSKGIQRLVWPARSPDLNPIENVWEALGRQVAGRNYPPTNKNTLIRALTEEWDKLPQQLLDNVVQNTEEDDYGYNLPDNPDEDENAESHSTVIEEFDLEGNDSVKDVEVVANTTVQTVLESTSEAEKKNNATLGETYIQFAARLTANFQYYCSLRKVNSFESLCDLLISDKLFETLNKETVTHIGIREAEDWFRPIDLAKECDIYISSRSGSRKETPIACGYTEDPFKNRDHEIINQRLKITIPNILKDKIKIAIYAVIHLITQEIVRSALSLKNLTATSIIEKREYFESRERKAKR